MNFSLRLQELNAAIAGCSYTNRQQSTFSEDIALVEVSKLIFRTVNLKGIVYVIGNGGSAGIASHFSNDLMKALGIASQTLYDSNLMTCLSNDIGYENVFSYPLQKMLTPNDLLVAISSSGQSKNILNAAEVALSRKAVLVTLSGFLPENPLRQMGDLNFWVSRKDYGLVESAHFFLLHTIIDLWNNPATKTKEYAYDVVH